MHTTGQAVVRRSRGSVRKTRLAITRGRKAVLSSAGALKRSTPKKSD